MPKPNPKSKTQTKKTHRFKSFSERLELVETDVLHTSADVAGPLSDELTMPCHYLAEVLRWHELNLTANFQTFMRRSLPMCQSLAQLLHHKREIVDLLLRHIPIQIDLSLKALLDCTASLARDLQNEFHPYLPEFVKVFTKLLETSNPDILEIVFSALAYLFKFLQKFLIKDFEGTITLLSPLFDHKKWYIRRFAAEVTAFLIRKVPHAMIENRIRFVLDCKGTDVSEAVIDGLGQLLFDSIQSVKRAFHSKAETILGACLNLMDPEAGADVFSTRRVLVRRMVYLALEHCRVETAIVIWDVLIPAADALLKTSSSSPSNVSSLAKRMKNVLELLVMCAAHRRGLRVGPVRKRLNNLVTRLVQASDGKKFGEFSAEIGRGASALSLALLRTSQPTDLDVAVESIGACFDLPLSSSLALSHRLSLLESEFPESLVSMILQSADRGLSGTEDEFIGSLLTAKFLFENHPTESKISLSKTSVTRLLSAVNSDPKIFHSPATGISLPALECVFALWVLPHLSLSGATAAKLISSITTLRQNIDGKLGAGDENEISRRLCAGVSVECSRLLRSLDPSFSNVSDPLTAIKNLLTASSSYADAVEEAANILENSNLKFSDSDRTALLDILAPNLSAADPPLRRNTIYFLLKLCGSAGEAESYADAEGGEKRKLKSAPKSSKKSKQENIADEPSAANYFLEILDLMLQIEDAPMDAIEGKAKVHLIQKITSKINFDRMSEADVGPLVHFLIGQIRTRFSMIWPPTVDALAALGEKYKLKFWSFFESHLTYAAARWQEEGERSEVLEDVEEEEEGDEEGEEGEGEAQEEKDEQADEMSDGGETAAGDETKTKKKKSFLIEPKKKLGTSDRIFGWDECEVELMAGGPEYRRLGFEHLKEKLLTTSRDGTDGCEVYVHLLLALKKSGSVMIVARDVVAKLFFKFLGIDPKEGEEITIKLSKSLNYQRVLGAYLEAFAHNNTLKVFPSKKIFEDIFIELIGKGTGQVQRKAFECLVLWKKDFITPYVDNLRRLIGDATLRDELSFFAIGGDSDMNTILPSHRPLLIPLVIRILYTKILQQGNKTSKSRRKMVLAYLAGLSLSELNPLFALSLRPFSATIKAAHSGPPGSDYAKGLDVATSEINLVAAPIVVGFLHVLKDMVKQLGSKMSVVIGDIFWVLTAVVNSVFGSTLDRAVGPDDTGRIYKGPHSSKTVRRFVLRRLADVFQSFTSISAHAQLFPPLLDCLAPITLHIHTERGQGCVGLLDMYRALSDSQTYAPYLYYKSKHSPEPILTSLFRMLSVYTSALDAKLATLHIVTQLTLPSNSLRGKFQDLIPDFLREAAVCLQNIHNNTTAVGTERAALTEVMGALFDILCVVSSYKCGETESHSVISLLIPFLKRGGKGAFTLTEEQKIFVLQTVKLLMGKVQDAERYVDALGRQLLSVSTAECRVLVSECLESPATKLGEISNLIKDMNAMEKGMRTGEPDWDVRLRAYRQISVEKLSTLSHSQICVLTCQALFDFRSDEISSRGSALNCLSTIVQALAPRLNTVHSEMQNSLRQSLVGEIERSVLVLPYRVRAFGPDSDLLHGLIMLTIRRYLVSSDLHVRSAAFNLVGVASKFLTQVYPDLHALSNADDDADFFTNMFHIQLHRRARAIQKLSKYCVYSHALASKPAPVASVEPASSTLSKKEKKAKKKADAMEIDGETAASQGEAEDVTAAWGKEGRVALRGLVARQFLWPVVFSYAVDPKGNMTNIKSQDTLLNVQHDAIKACGDMSLLLSWTHYLQAIKTILRKLKNKPSIKTGKILVKLLCAILDSFHFKLPEVEDQAPDLSTFARLSYHTPAKKSDDDDVEMDEVAEAPMAIKSGKRKVLAEAEDGEDENLDDALPEDTDLEGKAEAEIEAGDGEEEGEEGEEEEEEEGPVLRKREYLEGPEDVLSALTGIVLPGVLANMKEPRTGDESKDGGVRTSLALCAVRVLQLLPRATLNKMVPHLLRKVCTGLCSRSYRVRCETSVTLGQLISLLGPAYLPHACSELKTTLVKGYMSHVLGHAVYSVLKTLGPLLDGGYLITIAPFLLELYVDELTGTLAQQKTVSRLTTKTPEAKTSKALEVMKLVGKYSDLKTLNEVVVPNLKTAARACPTLKQRRRVQEMLLAVVKGIAKNTSLETEKLLMFAHHVISQHRESLGDSKLPAFQTNSDGKSDKKNKKDSKKVTLLTPKNKHAHEIPASWTLPKSIWAAMQKELELDATQTKTHGNDWVILEFAFFLLTSIIRKSNINLKDEKILKMLDPFVVVMYSGMRSKHASIVTQTIKIMSSLIELPLPSILTHRTPITDIMFRLIQKGGPTNTDTVQACFRLLCIYVRHNSSALTTDQTVVLLSWIKDDLDHPKRHSAAFHLLRALSAAKIILPEMYDLMNTVADILVISQSDSVRSQAVLTLTNFLTDYPLGNSRIVQHINHLIKNLGYDYETGRLSVLETLSVIAHKFPPEILEIFSDTVVAALVSRVSVDESEKARVTAAAVVKEIVSRSDKNRVSLFVNMATTWIDSDNPAIKSSGVQLVRLIVEQVGKRALSIFEMVNSKFKSILASASEENDNPVAHAMCIYHILTCVEKLSQNPTVVASAGWQSLVKAVTERDILVHEHSWVRMGAARLVGTFFAEIKDDAASYSQLPLFQCRQKSAEGSLHVIITAHCLALTHQNIEKKLADQIVKNLVFAAHLVQANAALFQPTTAQSITLSLAHSAAPSDAGTSKASESAANVDDDSTERLETNIGVGWILRRVSWVASRFRGLQRASALRCLAATSVKLGGEAMRDYVGIVVGPLFRAIEMSSTESEDDSCISLAREALTVIENVVGTHEFYEAYNNFRGLVAERQTARSQAKAISAFVNPARTSEEKSRKHQREKRKKKDKMEQQKRMRGIRQAPKEVESL